MAPLGPRGGESTKNACIIIIEIQKLDSKGVLALNSYSLKFSFCFNSSKICCFWQVIYLILCLFCKQNEESNFCNTGLLGGLNDIIPVKSLPPCPSWNKLIVSPFPLSNAMSPNPLYTLESAGVLLKITNVIPIPKQL